MVEEAIQLSLFDGIGILDYFSEKGSRISPMNRPGIKLLFLSLVKVVDGESRLLRPPTLFVCLLLGGASDSLLGGILLVSIVVSDGGLQVLVQWLQLSAKLCNAVVKITLVSESGQEHQSPFESQLFALPVHLRPLQFPPLASRNRLARNTVRRFQQWRGSTHAWLDQVTIQLPKIL